MKLTSRIIFLLILVLELSACIVSKRDKCYEDIRRGDKTMHIQDVCIQAVLFANYQGSDPVGVHGRDLYTMLCAAQLAEEDKCQEESNWIPTIDARM